MRKTEWHSEVTVRISDSTTITLSDEYGLFGSFIKDKLSKATDIVQVHELLIGMLQDSLDYHRNQADIWNQSHEDYSVSVRNRAKNLDVYVEGEV